MSENTTAKRAELGGLIAEKSDDEIVKGAQGMGPEKVLQPIFDGMRDAFMPDKAKGASAVIQYDVDVGGTLFQYQVVVKNGGCTVTSDGRASPRLTISAKLPDFLRLMSGRLTGVQAFFTGKVKLSGEMMLAPKMEAWFVKPAK